MTGLMSIALSWDNTTNSSSISNGDSGGGKNNKVSDFRKNFPLMAGIASAVIFVASLAAVSKTNEASLAFKIAQLSSLVLGGAALIVARENSQI